MDLTALSTFAAVARLGSVSAAAQELHTVQSNVTARIKQLEASLGTTLLNRHSRGVTLTPAGETLLQYALRIAALVDEAQSALRDDGSARGTLRIGTMETTAAVRLPKVLSRYHREHPQVRLEIRSGTSAEQLEQVLSHRLDGALVAGPVSHPELHCTPVFREELVLVSAAGSDSVEQRLAREALSAIVFRSGCTYRHCLESLFAARGWTPYQRLEFGTLDGILGCVAADVGVSLLPRSAVEAFRERDALRIAGVGKQSLSVDTLFVRRAGVHVAPALAAFAQALLASANTRAAGVRR